MTDRNRKPEPNAGAFLGPDIMIPVPMGTLGTDYPPDSPTGAAASTEPEHLASRLARFIRRLAGRSNRAG